MGTRLPLKSPHVRARGSVPATQQQAYTDAADDQLQGLIDQIRAHETWQNFPEGLPTSLQQREANGRPHSFGKTNLIRWSRLAAKATLPSVLEYMRRDGASGACTNGSAAGNASRLTTSETELRRTVAHFVELANSSCSPRTGTGTASAARTRAATATATGQPGRGGDDDDDDDEVPTPGTARPRASGNRPTYHPTTSSLSSVLSSGQIYPILDHLLINSTPVGSRRSDWQQEQVVRQSGYCISIEDPAPTTATRQRGAGSRLQQQNQQQQQQQQLAQAGYTPSYLRHGRWLPSCVPMSPSVDWGASSAVTPTPISRIERAGREQEQEHGHRSDGGPVNETAQDSYGDIEGGTGVAEASVEDQPDWEVLHDVIRQSRPSITRIKDALSREVHELERLSVRCEENAGAIRGYEEYLARARSGADENQAKHHRGRYIDPSSSTASMPPSLSSSSSSTTSTSSSCEGFPAAGPAAAAGAAAAAAIMSPHAEMQSYMLATAKQHLRAEQQAWYTGLLHKARDERARMQEDVSSRARDIERRLPETRLRELLEDCCSTMADLLYLLDRREWSRETAALIERWSDEYPRLV